MRRRLAGRALALLLVTSGGLGAQAGPQPAVEKIDVDAPDALCLLDREHRFVLTGDTFYLGRLFVRGEVRFDSFSIVAAPR